MKYRLKKDLPFAKAGTEIILHEGKLNYPHLTIERRNDDCLYVWCKDWRVYDFWIEEVKPREWYELFFEHFNHQTRIFGTPPFQSKTSAEEYIEIEKLEGAIPIKVREVIDG